MKKKLTIFTSSLLLALSVLILFGLLPVAPVSAQSMSIAQFVEMLISVGAIPADRIVAARAMVVTLSQTDSLAVSTSTSYIQVLSPNGGESWERDLDVPYSITWGSSGLTQVRISLVPTKGPACELGLPPIVSKNGNHEFKVLVKTAKCYNLLTGTSTPLKDGSYKVRVYYKDAKGTVISDEGAATFKILPVPIPSLNLTYPNGGETLTRHQEYAVKYSLKNVSDSDDGLIYYYLLDNNGNNALNGRKLMRSGTFDLELPSSLSAGAYKLKLKLTTDEHVPLEDISNNFFWISTGL